MQQINIFRLAVLMWLNRNVILFLCFILHLTKTIWCRHSIKTGILLLCLCIFFVLKSKWIGSDIFVFLLNNSDHGQVPLLACGAILEMTLMVFDIKTQFCYSVYKLINTSRTLSHLSKIVCWHRPFPIVQWRKTSLLALLGGLLKR